MRELITEVLASVYQASPGQLLWRWSGDGRAVEWASSPHAAGGGETIVFRAELREILARLAPQGLPSLTCVVLICAACRDGWREASRDGLARVLDDPEFVAQRGNRATRLALSLVVAGLDKVAGLPAELRRGVDAKAALCAALVGELPQRLDAREAGWVVDVLEAVEPAASHELDSGGSALAGLQSDLRALRAALDQHDPAALERRVRTGVAEALAAAEEVAIPAGEQVRRLLHELQDDPELGGVSRLARDLLAAVHVPRPLLDRDDQPLGGVADVSNRGPLHRLLVSELAHDDLTFVVRVATGEALYLRREPPARRPPRRRRVLIDTGIRLWGTPRVFATAVALALVADADDAVETYRTQRDQAVPARLTDRDGLLEQLEQLEAEPQPGAALTQLAALDDDDRDLVLVTHHDALGDPALRRRLGELSAAQTLYVAAVDGRGRYALWRYAARGRTRLARAQLDLDRVLRRDPDAPAGRELSIQPLERDLPSLLSVRPFPLLLPCPLRAERACFHPLYGVLATSPDRRLMHWPRPQQGAHELTPSLPPGLTRWLEIDDHGVGRCLRDGARAPVLVVADLPRGRVGQLDLAAPARPQAAFRLGDGLALLYPRHLALFALTHGERLAPLRLPAGAKHVAGRVFRLPDDGLHAVRWDGRRARLEPLPQPELHPRVLLTWERVGLDGVWALRDDGWVWPLGDEREGFQALAANSALGEARISASRDGQRLLVLDTRPRVGLSRGDAENRRLLIDLQARTTRRALGEPLALEPALAPFALSPTLRKRVEALAVDPQGRLALITRNQRVLVLVLEPLEPALTWLITQGSASLFKSLRGFVPVDPPQGRGFSLRKATWRDGSRAFLDGRGLLHLQGPRASDPELCLVLAERGPLAAWVSGPRGGLAGDGYFTGDAARRLSPAEAYAFVQTFVRGLP